MNHQDVLDRLAELFVDRGVPEYIRSDNGSEFTAQAVRDWLKAVGVRTLYIEPGSPWENGVRSKYSADPQVSIVQQVVTVTANRSQPWLSPNVFPLCV